MRINVRQGNAVARSFRLTSNEYFPLRVRNRGGRWAKIPRIEFLWHEVLHMLSLGIEPDPENDTDAMIDEVLQSRYHDGGRLNEALVLACQVVFFERLGLRFDYGDIERQAAAQGLSDDLLERALKWKRVPKLVDAVWWWSVQQGIIEVEGLEVVR